MNEQCYLFLPSIANCMILGTSTVPSLLTNLITLVFEDPAENDTGMYNCFVHNPQTDAFIQVKHIYVYVGKQVCKNNNNNSNKKQTNKRTACDSHPKISGAPFSSHRVVRFIGFSCSLLSYHKAL